MTWPIKRATDRTRMNSLQAWNRLVDALNYLFRFTVTSDRMKLVKGPNGMTLVDRPVNVEVRAKTQEAGSACGDAYISVKFVDDKNDVYGTAFDVKAEFHDGATAISQCLPDIQSGTFVWIQKIANTWYLKRPTLIKYTECP